MTPQLDIVVPVYNRWNLTAACLRSVRATTAREHVRVIVVDNGSKDRTPAEAEREAATGRGLLDHYVRLPENQGFARGCNAGLEASERFGFTAAPAVLFLNNDTELLPGWLPPLLEDLADDTIGVVGALLWYPGRVRAVQHAGMGFAPGGKVLHLYRHRRPEHEPGIFRAKDLQCVTGAFLAMRTAEARQLGGFCADYRNSFEDVDLCFRVRFELGKRVRYDPRIQLYHHEGQTEGRHLHELENEVLFGRRWAAKVEADIARIMREDRAAAGAPPAT